MKLENVDLKQPFVETEYIKNIAKRAMLYLNTGYAIHFKGPSGTGKTSLAMYIAKRMDKPYQIIFGNEEFGRTDLIGGNFGVTKKIVQDNYVHSVMKHQIDYNQKWIDGRLLNACKTGATLIYDEFTRSRAEANNVLLSILEEGVVEVPLNREKTRFVKVHPDFRIIFTSNPEEYSGIYKAQDALKSRMITIDLDFPDVDTELEIVLKNTEVDKRTAQYIVDVVRNFRESSSSKFHPTIRSSIMIANIMKMNKINLSKDKELEIKIFEDILLSESSNSQVSLEEKKKAKVLLEQITYN
ncbi:gas vesicle protein GvpN [Marinisporobacter balticus]|uniref:Gas vesicle protein GvpN n=1 Tax=Marinisporobacter balticus TaxID=2018667 RepID=A0A4R2L5J6_9FIRM|nr:gas vesicle protein GvpN [Marinisporobacter balticus]TCO77908.1 gas vesicle protein GvpN [Marinisporobacter balticus]